jgi:DNA polymerase-1
MFTLVNSLDLLNESLDQLSDDLVIACDLEADSLDTSKANIEGIGYGTEYKAFYIPFPHNINNVDIINFLSKLFEKTVVFHNAKYDMKLLLANSLPVPKKFHDTMIMSWLVDENRQHGLKVLTKEIFGKVPKKYDEVKRVPDLFTTQEDLVLEMAEYCCEDVKNTFALYKYFHPQLEEENVQVAYERVELKLIPVLMDMESRGIQVDVSWLQERSVAAHKELASLEARILNKLSKNMTSNEARFLNIRSPKQLERILFDILKYKVVKETASKKRSTDNEVLETIVRKHKLKETDVVPMLLKFRDLDKVNNTFFMTLAEQAGTENIIRANFLQHGTRTGRLASNAPNLQNIPSRHDEWNVRTAFVPREGYRFIIADYSQVELRMLAHFSQDKHMLDTFLTDGDIHGKTMELLGIDDRRIAKNVNFGIVYGVGPRTMSQLIQRPEVECKRYIEGFLSGYPQVRQFIYRVQQSTFRTGYVETIIGRRRHFHEFQDRRWFGNISRQSVNTKIQGSAADLIKIAMIKLHYALKEFDSHILVQIHDEVIVETPVDKIEEVKVVIKDIMEHALALRVPLRTSMVEGDRWIKG